METLRLVEEARRRGVDVTIDQYPYTASSTGMAALFPQWSLEGGHQAMVERLAAPDERARIKATIVENIQFDRGGGDPKNVVIANCPFDASLAGKNLAELTRARGVEPTFENAAETAIALETKGACSAVYHAIGEDDVVRILRSPLHHDRFRWRDSGLRTGRARIRAATERLPACLACTCGSSTC